MEKVLSGPKVKGMQASIRYLQGQLDEALKDHAFGYLKDWQLELAEAKWVPLITAANKKYYEYIL